jgi:hypothetical protein
VGGRLKMKSRLVFFTVSIAVDAPDDMSDDDIDNSFELNITEEAVVTNNKNVQVSLSNVEYDESFNTSYEGN